MAKPGDPRRPRSRAARPRRFDPDHVGAEVAQDSRRQRSGPHPGEVEDAQALERSVSQCRSGCRRRRRRRPVPFASLATQQEWPPRNERTAAAVDRHEEAASPEVRVVQHLQRIDHRTDRHPHPLPQFDDLGRRMGHHPRVDRAIELLTVLGPVGVLREARIFSDMTEAGGLEEGMKHLLGRHRQRHVAVLAAVHAHRVPRPALGIAHPPEDVARLGPHHRRVLVQRGQRLDVGHIDRLTAADRGPGQKSRQGPDHPVGARLEVSVKTRPCDRLPVRRSVQVQVPRPGVVGELVRPRRSRLTPDLAFPRAEPERRDAKQHGLRRVVLRNQRFEWFRRRTLDHDVDSVALDLFQDLRPPPVTTRPQLHRALAGIQVRVRGANAPPALADLAPRVPAVRFEAQHLGAASPKQQTGVGARRRTADFDHAQVGTGPGHRSGTVTASRTLLHRR